ncbi:MAG TPA: D-arabinono-1,4-lactone oxidase [Solirubrobacteraceae bacterium]|nr:D-arabinono-1,4-lactone oxidase [Solirubrobacteraceae bacterium]
MGTERNWAGTYAYGARALHRPSTLEALQVIVARAPKVRALGSRHSFSGIADSDELVSVDDLPPEIVVDEDASTVSCGAGVRYGELARALHAQGLALHNLASLPHICVAGAVATGTHGSGDASGNLATAVAGLTLVTSAGDIVEATRADPDFDGLVVNLGALGVVTRLTLDVEPAYEVRQRVFERLPWEAVLDVDAIMSTGYSVSAFTHFGPVAEQVWVKSRDEDAPAPARDLFGAVPAADHVHPIAGVDATAATPQMGVAGPWFERLPHFRMEFTPSAGDELQSEYLVGREHAADALEAVRSLASDIQPLLQVCEIRTIAGDELWMSPHHGRDSIGIHFTWKPDQPAVERVLMRIEAALAPFSARPHWGKLFLMDAAAIAPRYERLPDFRRLAERLDPRGAFRNAWLEQHVLGGE